MVDTQRPPGGSGSGSRRRAELLAIAAELFAVRGFVATSVREIADTAGILSGSLYHHFDSKEAMVDEILREFLDSQRRAFERVVAEVPEPRATMAELIRQSFRAMHQHRPAIVILDNEGEYLSRFERFGYLRQVTDEFERTWIRVLRDGQRRGVFRSDLNARLAYRFIRDAVSSAVRWYNPRGRLSAQAITEQYIELFCGGIVVPP